MKDLNPIVWVKVGLGMFYMGLLCIVALALESEKPLYFIPFIILLVDKVDVVEYVEEIPKKEPADESTHPSS
ncbi:hypothetical protein INR75_02940 [Zunongwangia sp. SCSIO 43204]|uniref:hypothetical protein n=1 Tax=Zunongwangia sp. SCSIO 43204 TaxID=2779359 RepID=UPI001CA83BF3|nr:hypothetical protein [Zunongwangia sp. SCSIO 43204]UAB85003.1 hypothetical protein INR75_02940 [Zunongwangia sp. SCSIO 43204]